MVRASKELALAKERVVQLEKKEAVLKARQPRAYKARPEQSIVYYRSLFANSTIYQLNASSENLTLIGGADDVGLKTTLGAGENAVTVAGFKPSQILWIYGDATPTRVKTDWGTAYTKDYDKNQGQSHRTLPFSKVSGVITDDELITTFLTMFNGTAATKKSLVGDRGRAYLKLERKVISAKPVD